MEETEQGREVLGIPVDDLVRIYGDTEAPHDQEAEISDEGATAPDQVARGQIELLCELDGLDD